MHEFDLIKKYFSKLSKLNKSSLNLNDDVFFDRKKKGAEAAKAVTSILLEK